MTSVFAERHPVRGLLRLIMRVPILVYRLGIGQLLWQRLALLTTSSQNSGQPRPSEYNHAMATVFSMILLTPDKN
ncbi:MAG: hypothetical protein ACM3H7_04450 [Acidobacteriaceae bacterium]